MIKRVHARLEQAAAGRTQPGDVDAALERARAGLEELARSAAGLEAALPERVGAAVREGMRAEALPVARRLAEVRGLTGQVLGRLERLEGDLLAERHARIDDLALLVELITSGWQGLADRLDRLERALEPSATVHRIEERRSS